jgi:lipid-binding SYLF domain-containing protein
VKPFSRREKIVKIPILRRFPKAKLLFLALACTVATLANASTDVEKQQKQIRSMTQDTLQQLYKADPRTKAAVKNAYGYAVFSDLGVKILFAGSGNGKGLAVNNKTKHETFMKMIELQAGLGMGVDKFRVIFLFDNKQAFDGFVNSGWEFGGQSTAAAKYGDKGAAMGGAVSVADGVWMYQLPEKGLAADISATGTKYYKDDELN